MEPAWLADNTEAGREGRHITKVTERAVIGINGTKATSIQSTVGTGDVHLSFTAKQAAVLTGSAVVRVEAGFEHKTNLGIANVFRASQTPAVARGETGRHFNRVGRGRIVIKILVGIGEARIHAAIQRDRRSRESGSGESAKQSGGDERLLHEKFSSVNFLGLMANRYVICLERNIANRQFQSQ